MKKRVFSYLVALTLGIATLTGCAGSSTTKGTKISIVGSTTVAEPMEKLIEEYKQVDTNSNIEVQGNGSSAGIKAAISGTADIGMSSRGLSEDEKKAGLTETTIAYDGITIVVHPTNGVTNLTLQQVKDIYEGKIKNWSEVGGNDSLIIVVTREAGAGTRGAFEEIVGLIDENKGSTIVDTALVAEGTGSVMATVASKEGAIGFGSLGYLNDTVKPVAIDGITPSAETVKSGEYMIARPLILVTSAEIKQEAQEVVDFILGEAGQKVLAEKYIPIID